MDREEIIMNEISEELQEKYRSMESEDLRELLRAHCISEGKPPITMDKVWFICQVLADHRPDDPEATERGLEDLCRRCARWQHPG